MLPVECLNDVFAFLTASQLGNIECVSRRYRAVCLRHVFVVVERLEVFFIASRCQILLTFRQNSNHTLMPKVRLSVSKLKKLLATRRLHFMDVHFMVCSSNCEDAFDRSHTDEFDDEVKHALSHNLLPRLNEHTRFSVVIVRSIVSETKEYHQSLDFCLKYTLKTVPRNRTAYIGVVYLDEAAESADFKILTSSDYFRQLCRTHNVVIEVEGDKLSFKFLDDLAIYLAHNNSLEETSLYLAIYAKFPRNFHNFLQQLKENFCSANVPSQYTLKWCYLIPVNEENIFLENIKTNECFHLEYEAHGCKVLRCPTQLLKSRKKTENFLTDRYLAQRC